MKKKAEDITKGDRIRLKEAGGDHEVLAALDSSILIDFDGLDLWIPTSIIEIERSLLSAESLDRIFFFQTLPDWFVKQKNIY